MNKIAITTGDPNGIGAEITIKALKEINLPKEKFVIISNHDIIDFYGTLDKDYEIIDIPYAKKDIKPGEITKEAGEFSFQALKQVCKINPQAIVTAPVAKSSLHLAGYDFNGQTEILQKFLAKDSQLAEMLFVANHFRVLLLTRHCPLTQVHITRDILITKIHNLVKTFKTQFGIANPKFALCGFNPHSGENGILGSEEQDIIIPAVKELQSQGIDITMPLPADTLFVDAAQHYYQNSKDKYDCYIANYHDQGLIPIKTVAGINTVNMTIGLDIIRTSPGHGTAFDIAGSNLANPAGMIEAIKSIL